VISDSRFSFIFLYLDSLHRQTTTPLSFRHRSTINSAQKKIYFFIYLLSKRIQHSTSLSERVCEPLYSETGVTPLSSNNFNQTFPVTHDQSCTSAWRNFGPFLLTELLQLRDICGVSCINGLLQILPHHLSWVNAWTSTLHSKMQNLFCFIQSVVDVLVCLGSSSCCMIHFLLSFSSQTDVLTFSCGIS